MDRGLQFLFEDTQSLSNYRGISENGAYGWVMPNDPKRFHVPSKFQPGKLINYRGRQFNHSDFTPYSVELTGLGSTQTPNDQSDTSVKELLNWSQRYPAITFRAADFAYCSDMEKYPNNRLAVLRRFAGPIGNNLFVPGASPVGYPPISTIVSWIPPEEQDFFKISFGEKWVAQNEDIFDVLKSRLSKITGSVGNSTVGDALGKQVIYKILESLGVTSLSFEDFFGSPDIIRSTHRRATDGDGFSFDFNYTVTARYEFRHLLTRNPNGSLNQVDGQVAMLDILGNIIRMGTSDSIFRLDTGFAMFSTNILDAMSAGRTSQILEQLIRGAMNAIKSMVGSLVEAVKNTADEFKQKAGEKGVLAAAGEVALGKLKKLADATLQGILAEHRVMLTGAIAGASGLPNAPWHLTLGNPKKPVMSIGNLVCEKVDVTGKNELGFDDWPTALEAKFTLKNARPLGAQEIENIFNAAQQRIYYRQIVTFPDAGGNKIIVNRTDEEIKALTGDTKDRQKKMKEFQKTEDKPTNNSTGQVTETKKEEAKTTTPTSPGNNTGDVASILPENVVSENQTKPPEKS